MTLLSFGTPHGCLPAQGRGLPFPGECGALLRRLGIVCAGYALVAGPAQALEFGEALQIAEQHSPRTAAQRLQIEAADTARKAAGTLPDPKLSVGIENLPVSGMDRWSLTRESMTMQRLALMQEVPNQAKRDAQAATARARVERERAALVLQRLQIRQEVSLAWIAAQAIEQRERLLAELLQENQRLQDSLPARVAAGTASAGDLLAARQEALALSDRRDDLQRDRAKARAALRRWVGPRADEGLQSGPGPLARPIEQMRADLPRHAELAQYPALRNMAQAESHEAQADSRGDWSWEVAYSRRGRQWGDMVSFQVTFDLPWQRGGGRRRWPRPSSLRRSASRWSRKTRCGGICRSWTTARPSCRPWSARSSGCSPRACGWHRAARTWRWPATRPPRAIWGPCWAHAPRCWRRACA
nr:TolC family protein [Paenacidovorax monticola]